MYFLHLIINVTFNIHDKQDVVRGLRNGHMYHGLRHEHAAQIIMAGQMQSAV